LSLRGHCLGWKQNSARRRRPASQAVMNSFRPKVMNLMGAADDFDMAVIGGGIMGCATALNLARGGMRTVLLDRRGLCMEASGVNAGTLTHRTGPVSMQPYY